MKKQLYAVCFVFVLFLVGCKMDKSYIYELTVVNVGGSDISGVVLRFGNKEKSVGILGKGEDYAKTDLYFETMIAYPVSIEYTKEDAAADDVVVIKGERIKVVGQLIYDKEDQTVLVEIDPDHQRAIVKVNSYVPPR